MKITYKFADATMSEVEVSEEIGTLIMDSRREEENAARKERYHCWSLDAIDYEGAEYSVPDFTDALFDSSNERDALVRAAFSRLSDVQRRRLLMENNLLSALRAIDVAQLTRAEWISVGMALKEEGYPCSIWDDWSRNDPRYHPGECERKWKGFHGNGTPVKGGTIVQMAKDRGCTMFGEDGCMAWDDTIEYDGVTDGFSGFVPSAAWIPAQDLITYLELLFEPDDKVGYVTNDVWQDADGRWVPSKGVYDRTAAELIASVRKHPDDLGATVGDWKPQVGAWIRFNPLDGTGVKNENVTRFRYALVESDEDEPHGSNPVGLFLCPRR